MSVPRRSLATELHVFPVAVALVASRAAGRGGDMSELLAGKVQAGFGDAARWLNLFDAAYSDVVEIRLPLTRVQG